MGGRVFLTFLLVLLCASRGCTDDYSCTQKEGTPFTVLVDKILTYGDVSFYLGKILDSVSARFPCVTQQYTSVVLDFAETNETITNDRIEFLESITVPWEDFSQDTSYYYYDHILQCNQFLFYGLKRALEISPAESLILVLTHGSMVDYDDTLLLSEVYTLLEEKKSQVYFLWYHRWYCPINASQQDVLEKISSLSYGEFLEMGNGNNYKLAHSLELLLSKPLNSSVRLLNVNQNVTEYTEEFSVPTSLTYLLITRDERFALNITDPNGNIFAFEKKLYYNHEFDYNYDILSSHLIKRPAVGSWILNAQGNLPLSVQILGFTELDKSGNCLDSDCHQNASCSEFGGYGECTCKEGFAGDGTSCKDIDECQNFYTYNCNYYTSNSHCVNTIGSYTCECNPGYTHISELGCVDIDECADSSLNDCDPVAICKNYMGYYTCTCPYGYYGDGRHCEVNECQQGTPCGSNEECIKSIGSYSCNDPCSNHTVLNNPWRSTYNTYNINNYHCDSDLSGWYRFKGEYDQQIPEHCVTENSCGTSNPIWMNGSHPTVSDGIINRTACSNSDYSCCKKSYNIFVKRCPGGFYVYKLQSTPTCNSAYCTENSNSPSTGTEGYHCTQREGTSLTVLMDQARMYVNVKYRLEKFLNSALARFPCVTRQYTTITLDFDETNETITNDMRDFLQSTIVGKDYLNYDYYRYTLGCNQSLLYGLKRALEISPAESIILVYTAGSVADYNDTQLLSEVYTLLEETNSQVYFLLYPGYCTLTASQKDLINDISSLSYGTFIEKGDGNNYKQWYSLEFLLSKPLNSTVRILNIHRIVTGKYTEVFRVPTSLTYLLITIDEQFAVNITDPNGNTFSFERNPFFDDSRPLSIFDVLSSHLIKNPDAGSWILNATGKSSFSITILGFTGLDKSGNCLDSDCNPNATCSEFGGYGECTCKEGFAGDGTFCIDIDECMDPYAHNCNYIPRSCVNTIGSYTCNCNGGFEYKAEFGCVDIDECADSSLNDCDPVAICINYIGSYFCTCPYGYYGDGRHCEVNECQQGTLCGSNEECMKYIGSYSCIDPCSNHTVLNDPWRSTSNKYNYYYHCDYGLSGWYRFKGEYDQQIPEHCVAENSCGTASPIWMNGSHPTVSDGIINRTACSSWYNNCCSQSDNIFVKMCTEGFYVYKLQGTLRCYSAYCTESNHSCSGLDCAPDEECGIVDGVHGCYCKDSSNTTDGIQPGNVEDNLTPQIICGLENIKVRISKCLVERLGYNTSSIHLIDNYCQGFIERSDKSYITLIMRPADGSCGGYIVNNGTHNTYTNTVYLTPQSDGDGYSINYYCTYPSDINHQTTAST